MTAEAENHSLYRHHIDPSAKNQCDHPSQSTKNLLPLVPHCYPLPSLLSAAPQRYPKPREYRTMCTVRKRTRRTARFTYQRISILIPWIQFTSWIARVETTGKTTKHRARYRPCWRRGRSLSTGRRDGRKIASYARRICVSFKTELVVLTCVRFETGYRMICKFYEKGLYDSYLNGKRHCD